MAEIELSVRIRLRVHLEQEGEWWVATCRQLGVASQGATPAEARKNFSEALSLFVVGCLEMGTLETVLRDAGFTKIGGPRPVARWWRDALRLFIPTSRRTEDEIEVPIEVLAATRDSNSTCRPN